MSDIVQVEVSERCGGMGQTIKNFVVMNERRRKMKTALWAVVAAIVVLQLSIANTGANTAASSHSEAEVRELKLQVSLLQNELATVRQEMNIPAFSKNDILID
jgi:seryl-tRNA synthetase